MLLHQDYSTTLSACVLSREEGRLDDSSNGIIDRAVTDAKDIYSFSNDKVMNETSTKHYDTPSCWHLSHITVEHTSPSVHDSCDEIIDTMEPTPIGSNIDIVEVFDHDHGHVPMDSWGKLLETLNQAEDSMSEHSSLSDSYETEENAIIGSKRRQYLYIDHNTTAPAKRQKMMTLPKRLLTARHESGSSLPSYLFHCSNDKVTAAANEVPSSWDATIAATPKISFRESHVDNWETQYEKMVEFCAQHGHCFVPYNFLENPSLSRWVKRQRYQHKLKQQGRHHTLTNDRKNKLDALGFIWDSHKAIWEERYCELLQYRKAFGRTDVPFKFQNKKLAIWVKCQRRQYRLYLQDKQSSMTPERITKLNRIDFAWTCRES